MLGCGVGRSLRAFGALQNKPGALKSTHISPGGVAAPPRPAGPPPRGPPSKPPGAFDELDRDQWDRGRGLNWACYRRGGQPLETAGSGDQWWWGVISALICMRNPFGIKGPHPESLCRLHLCRCCLWRRRRPAGAASNRLKFRRIWTSGSVC